MRGAAGGACLRNCHSSWSAIFCCTLLGRTEVRRRQRLSEHRGCQNRTEGRHGEDKREQQRSIFRRSPEPGRRWHFAVMAAKAEGRDPCKNRERQCCVMWTAGMMPTPPRTVRAACRGQSGLRKFYDAHRGARDERALATYPEGYVAAHTVGRTASACCARCCAHRGARRARVFAANLVSDARLHSFACGSVFEPRRTRGDLLGRVPSCLRTQGVTFVGLFRKSRLRRPLSQSQCGGKT